MRCLSLEEWRELCLCGVVRLDGVDPRVHDVVDDDAVLSMAELR